MKSSELHKLLKQNGWSAVRQRGSHVIYEKDGQIIYPIMEARKCQPERQTRF